MLITKKRPIYPQLTQAPITTYTDFLNFFRGGHTIDDNLDSGAIKSTKQYSMFSTAIDSGHLKKSKNMAIPDEYLADIFLTEAGEELAQTALDRKFCELAVTEARKSVAEADGEPHPCVGALVVRDGTILATGFRGETGAGRHAEGCALKKMNDDVDQVDLSGCTVYTTLEPCSERKPGKTACATRLINANVSRVVFGLADKDESVYGHVSLTEANIAVSLFPKDLIQELVALNKDWSDTRRQPEVAPPPNNTSCIANASYYKPGTPMTDNIHLTVWKPDSEADFFTIQDASKEVLAWGRTMREIAVRWHQINDQKVIVEGLQRVGAGASHQLLALR